MPMKSRAQNRFMHAAAADPEVAERLKIKPKVAKKFVKESRGQKVSRLPERKVQKLAKGGRVKDSPIDPQKRDMNRIETQNYDVLRTGKKKFRPDEAREYATSPSGRLPMVDEREEPAARSDIKILGTRKSFDDLKQRQQYAQGGTVKADKPSCKW